MTQDDKTQLWIAIGNQPGTGAWFSVWLVTRAKRVRKPAAAPLKKMSDGTCTA